MMDEFTQRRLRKMDETFAQRIVVDPVNWPIIWPGENAMTNGHTTESLRCESCHEPSGDPIGSPCPMDCEFSRVILAIECGRYTVEVSADTGDGFRASGFVGENLSREYGVKNYKSKNVAIVSGKQWLTKKNENAE